MKVNTALRTLTMTLQITDNVTVQSKDAAGLAGGGGRFEGQLARIIGHNMLINHKYLRRMKNCCIYVW